VTADVVPISRRDRVRAATSREIIQTARRLLVEHGSAEISLRAIAREMGMTAPALYRYYVSYEALVQHVVADIFTDLSDYVEAAVSAAGVPGWDQDGTADPASGQAGASGSAGEAGAQAATQATAIGLITACQAFRDWSVSHQAEFSMIFGSPLPGIDLYQDDPLIDCGMRFGRIFMRLFARLWHVQPFDVPADGALAPSMRAQLAHYRDMAGADLPLGVLQTFLRCWVLLYGTVTLEVFGHLRFALEDSGGMFDLMLTDLASMIGLQFPVPAP
jgi:AcrR family transcriptional regulator